MQVDTNHVQWGEIINRQFGWPLFIICFGVMLHALDSLVVATMLPAMVTEVGGVYLVAWTVSLYEVGTVVFSAMSGLVALRYGVKWPMFYTAIVFGSGCAVSALAPSMEVILVGRLLQGFGGGGLLAISFVASAIVFPKHTMARVMGAISIFWGSAGFLGPLLGSLFVEYLTWRTGFWIFSIAGFLLSILIIHKIDNSQKLQEDSSAAGYPVRRVLLITVGILLVAAAGVEVSAVTSPLLIIAGLVCMIWFLALDARQDKIRMLPASPLNFIKPIGSALTLILCMSAATVALPIYGALILTSTHGASTLVAGYVIACPAIGWALATIFVSGLPERLDARMTKIGMCIASIGIIGFVYAVPNGPAVLVALFAFVEGAGFGISWAFIPRLIRHLSEPSEIERNTGAIPTAQAIGYAIGAAYIGIVGNWSGVADSVTEGISYFAATIIFLTCVPLSLFGLIAMQRFVR